VYPVTARFLAALTEAHTVVTRVTLYRTDGKAEVLDHIGGSVTVDRRSATRRTCTVTLADPTLIPRTAADRISVYGARLQIARGIRYNDGAEELVPLGTFRIDRVEGDVDDGPATISGKSLEAVVADDKFTAPYRASGTAVGAITALIQRSIPTAVVTSTATDATIGPRTWDIQGDPWAAVMEIGATIGAEVYADADGIFTIAELPDPLTATPVWTIAASEGGAYIQADRGMSLDNVYNAVLARGENAEDGVPPVSALVTDTDPGSPTYWDGPFGHRPTFISSPTLIDVGQCTSAATLRLRSARAANASADISSLPNPALACGDVIRVRYMDGTSELHQADSFTVPLDVAGDFPIRTIAAKEDA
jgi:hypothetical protein